MMRIVGLMTAVVLLGACHIQSSPDTTPKASSTGIHYSGGAGTDCSNAVVITGAKNTDQGIAAENAWIRSRFPGAKKVGQALWAGNEKAYDVITIAMTDGTEQDVCFDITAFFGKY